MMLRCLGVGEVGDEEVVESAGEGLSGRLHWYAMPPFHWAIFARPARAIVRHAEADDSSRPRP
jgi:hypothetical protein